MPGRLAAYQLDLKRCWNLRIAWNIVSRRSGLRCRGGIGLKLLRTDVPLDGESVNLTARLPPANGGIEAVTQMWLLGQVWPLRRPIRLCLGEAS